MNVRFRETSFYTGYDGDLIVGKTYKVIETKPIHFIDTVFDYYLILNENGEPKQYLSYYFDIIMRKDKLKRILKHEKN